MYAIELFMVNFIEKFKNFQLRNFILPNKAHH